MLPAIAQEITYDTTKPIILPVGSISYLLSNHVPKSDPKTEETPNTSNIATTVTYVLFLNFFFSASFISLILYSTGVLYNNNQLEKTLYGGFSN